VSAGVRISSLRVDAFRGISDPIVFDLSSPITLVFAPNGTGKTTLCEAAEWLLTGQVERLKEGKDFNPQVLQSKWVKDQRQPSVVGQIWVGGEQRHLSRLVNGEAQETEFGAAAGDAVSIGPNELLSFLAPSAAANETHHLRAINLRQRWLRGTRFLTAEALAALVDSDDDTIQRRTQVFADLLGIRHLLDAEQLCDKYIADLGSRERLLSQRILGQEAEIATLKTALDTAGVTTSALSELEAAEAALGLEADNLNVVDPNVAGRIEAAMAEQGRRKHLAELRSSTIETVAAQWEVRVEAETKLAALSQSASILAARLVQIETDGRLAATAVSETAARQTLQSETARLLTSARDALTKHANTLAGTLGVQGDASPPIDLTATIASLYLRLPQSQWSSDERARRGVALRAAIASFGNDAEEARRIELLRGQLDALAPNLMSEEAIALLRSEAAALELAESDAIARLQATSGPLARLQGAARDLLEHAHDDEASECPVCKHDWGDASRLRSAITSTLDTVPELGHLAQVAAGSASQAARLAASRLEEAVLRRAQADRLRSELQTLEQAYSRRRLDLDALGLSSEDPLTSLRTADWHLSIATALAALVEERRRFETLLSLPAASLFGDETPIPGLAAQLQQSVAVLEQAIQLQLSAVVTELQEKTAERDRLRREHSVAQQQLRDCRQELQGLTVEASRLAALWDEAAPGRAFTSAMLQEVRQEIAEETAIVAGAAAALAAASAAWSVQVRRERLEQLTAEVAPAREQCARMTLRIDAAKRAKATFHEAYNDVSKRQIEDLSRVVNPLFARMHANRVFDNIRLGQTDEPLRWLADAGNQAMDPGKDFSQGQRQDLALALFLGRARSLGGTFFLDEPVTHLDDLNRVGLLDIFRATVMESSPTVNLVITTASKALARHLIEKFSAVGPVETPAGRTVPLRVLELDGNGRTGVIMRNAYPG